MFSFKHSKYDIPLVESSIEYLKSSPTKIYVFFFSQIILIILRGKKNHSTQIINFTISLLLSLYFSKFETNNLIFSKGFEQEVVIGEGSTQKVVVIHLDEKQMTAKPKKNSI